MSSPGLMGFAWAHIGWMTSSRNFPTNYDLVRDLARYPELRFLNRFDLVVPALFGMALYGLGAVLEALARPLARPSWQMIVWGFFISTMVLFRATSSVNSLAHSWAADGSRRRMTAVTACCSR